MIDAQPIETWDLWYPGAASTGLPFARGRLDRIEQTVESVENARELLIGAFDVYMATSAQRSNDVMKALPS